MQIFPNKPYPTNSKAEKKVFNKISESFINNNSYIAFHSLNLTKHQTKKFGEADFVIVCEYGIFVLEVKGGGIKYIDEQWYTIDRNNNEYKIQDPFRQAEGALHAIKNDILQSKLFPNLRLSIGFGVIFPDVEWTQRGFEWDSQTLCDNKKLRNFESWLRNFFKYWESKPNNYNKLSTQDIKALKQYLRPNFELVEPLYIKLEHIEDTVVQLTEDQYKYLDIVSYNRRVLCSGGAGTGKTFLAAELARRMADENSNIAIVCKSNWLKRFLESKIQNEFVTISTIESVKVDMRRNGIDSYDILIVDEGQDLFDYDHIDTLDEILKNGLEEGSWYIFHDVNNQSGLFIDTKKEMLELLESYTPAKIPLTTNCRNSEQILKKVQDSLLLDMGNKGTGIGPEVREALASKDDSSTLESEITYLLKGGVSPSSITILSPLCFEKSSISLLSEKLKKNIIELDDFAVRSLPIPEISFSEIKNFKGLENEVIILIDLHKPSKLEEQDKVKYYVAMSRARGLLTIVWK